MTHIVVFDKTKPKPKWLCKQNLQDTRAWNYWHRIWDAQPVWASREKIMALYKEAARLRNLGYDVVVDHIVPLHGENVCGLHHEDNLQIVDRVANAQKSNLHYPGAPHEQFEMFSKPAFLKRPPKQSKLL